MVNIVNLPPPPPAIVTNHSTETKANENRLNLFESPVSLGSKNDQVKALQEKLQKLGYLRGPSDGKFGRDTELALRSFQRVNGLPENGVLGPRTIAAIKRMPVSYDSKLFAMSNYAHLLEANTEGNNSQPLVMNAVSVRFPEVLVTNAAIANPKNKVPFAPLDASARRKATEDLGRIGMLAPMISRIATRYDIPPAILAAIVSRESRGRNVIGDNGYGHGLAQVDSGSFLEWTRRWRASGKPAEEGLRKGAEIFANKRSFLRGRFSSLTSDQLTAATLSSYNAGEGTVAWALRRGVSPDSYTTGKNYSRDVLNRAAVFAEKFPQWSSNN
ncbi:MAG: peptidoglycan-binding protein [Myxococcota bacterium]|nr:peptidoglycan-binding protein [Myxococcota bacterium]